MRKCHNCKGTGYVKFKDGETLCYYCRGKGFRYNKYGRDNTNGKTKIKKCEK
jgi:RecJ-like exonuclease